MTDWVILVDPPKDFPNADTPHKVITTREYLARPRLFDRARPKIINLSRSYTYQIDGYYASLLAEARGHRVIPTVETMLDLREAKLYEQALPELEDALNRCARRADCQPEGELKLLVCFGIARDERFEPFGRLLFDWFRCPALEVDDRAPATWLSIKRIRPRTITRLANGEAELLPRGAAPPHQARMARPQGAHASRKYDLAVLLRSRTRRCRRRSPALDQALGAHRREAAASRSSRSPSATSPSSPNSTRCSSARPPRSTTTPTASPAAPCRRACRSSTTRSR